MITHIISDTSTEKIALVVDDDMFALVHLIKVGEDTPKPKTIVMNKRELLTLYQLIQEIILKGG